jgi:hypothetical protein
MLIIFIVLSKTFVEEVVFFPPRLFCFIRMCGAEEYNNCKSYVLLQLGATSSNCTEVSTVFALASPLQMSTQQNTMINVLR